MNSQEHIIKKCVFEVVIQNEKGASLTHDKIIALVEHELVNILNQIFSDVSSGDEYIEIDKLEIDLGMIDEKKLAIGNAGKELADKLFVEAKVGIINKIKENKREEIRKVPLVKKEIELLVFFLRNGCFPWWSKEVISIEQLYEKLVLKDLKDITSVLTEELKYDNALVRFIYQFSDHQISSLLAKVLSYKHQAISNYLTKKTELIEQLKPYFGRKSRMIVWKGILRDLATDNFSDFLEDRLDKSIVHEIAYEVKKITGISILNKEIYDFDETVGHLAPITNQKDIASNKNYQSKKDIDPLIGERSLLNLLNNDLVNKNLGKAFPVFEKTFIQKKIADESVLAPQPVKKAKKEEDTLFVDEVEIKDEIFINNAGIILFWPYLSPFFNALDLLERDNIKDEDSRLKAVYLLQYLATENVNAEEHEVFLNKILCGFSSSDPLEKISSLAPNEIEEAEALIMAVISHWEILGNTSPEALRETFIQREGILTFKEDYGWQLKVERKGVDMLMSSLPWGLSIITLPWMKNPIYVEW